MDKSWMRLGETTKGRFSSNYSDGVTAFLESAKRVNYDFPDIGDDDAESSSMSGHGNGAFQPSSMYAPIQVAEEDLNGPGQRNGVDSGVIARDVIIQALNDDNIDDDDDDNDDMDADDVLGEKQYDEHVNGDDDMDDDSDDDM